MTERSALRDRVLDQVPLGILILGADGVVRFWNSCLENWTSLRRDEVVGTRLADRFTHFGTPSYTTRLQTIFDGGPPAIFSSQLHGSLIPAPLPGGRLRTQHTTVRAIPAGSGAGFDALFAVQDVTDLAQLARRYREVRDRAQQANDELEMFASSVSHDLRAPLRAMQGFASALLEDYGDRFDDLGRDYAERIVASGRRMEQLIEDLLEYSRLSRAELNAEPIELDAVVHQALQACDAGIRESGAQITVRSPLAAVLAHRATAIQIASNLVGNAIKFAQPDKPPQVEVWTEPHGATVRLSIKDNGIGVEEDKQQRIFRMFERLHGVDSYPGTGVGLAIVRRAVERLGGRVGLDSAVGAGSTFWIELAAARPIDPSEAEADPATSTSVAQGTPR